MSKCKRKWVLADIITEAHNEPPTDARRAAEMSFIAPLHPLLKRRKKKKKK